MYFYMPKLRCKTDILSAVVYKEVSIGYKKMHEVYYLTSKY